jgi:6-phosphogluconolactonase
VPLFLSWCATLTSMKIIRLWLLLFAFLMPLFVFIPARPAENSPASHKYFVYVGSYTAKTDSKGIYLYEFSTGTGKLVPMGLAAETADPSWLAIHPSGKFLFAANETEKNGTVSAFAIDSKSGKLTFLNKLSALGESPCYLSFDRTGKYLFVANYSSGSVVVFPILPNGRLGEHTSLLTDQGSVGPNKQRQEGPHAHWIQASPDNQFVYVADLGLDRILIYKFDAAKGTLAPSEPADKYSLVMTPGDGPRHLTFSADRKYMYVLSELTGTVTVFSSEGHNIFESLQEIPSLPKAFTGRNDAAEIAMLPDGKFLYTSNRGHDAVSVFAVDSARGTLTQTADVPTGGKEPRHFAIDPSGRYLLAENQNTNAIVEFSIDEKTGALKKVATFDNVISPISIAFLPVD